MFTTFLLPWPTGAIDETSALILWHRSVASMSANDACVLPAYHGHCGGCQCRWPSVANQRVTSEYSSIASGAVRRTAHRVQPCGSSNPRCPFASWYATSIGQRQAKRVSSVTAVSSSGQVEK